MRLIIQSLGDIDYGIYCLMGGVISLLGFVSSSMAQTSVRYLSVSLGTSDNTNTRKAFQSCFWLHLILGFFLFSIFEICVPFLFYGGLNIPDDRLFAAQLVYQCLIVSLFLSVAITPFGALISSHERFWFSSTLGIAFYMAKLVVAICVFYYEGDRLILFAILMLFIRILNICCTVGYSYYHFNNNISLRFSSKKEILSMTGFAGWTLLDVLGMVANRQGYAVLLNKFFGPVCNATFGIARQVDEHLYRMSASVIDVMKPQIMKSHGSGNEERMFRLSMTAGKFGFSMMALATIPLMVMLDDVLKLWLGTVPEDTAVFTMLIVIAEMGEQLTRGLVYANQALGNIKWFSIIVSTARIMCIPISVTVLLLGYSAVVALEIYVIFEIIASLLRVFVLSRTSSFNGNCFVYSLLFQIIPPLTIAIIICYVLYSNLPHSIIGMLINTIITCLSYMMLIFFMGLTKEENIVVRELFNKIMARAVSNL